jgi:hypothetical protein
MPGILTSSEKSALATAGNAAENKKVNAAALGRKKQKCMIDSSQKARVAKKHPFADLLSDFMEGNALESLSFKTFTKG